MSLIGLSALAQACSSSLSPSNCGTAGGSYDGDNEVCVCAADSSGFTLAQQQALCTSAGADTTWDATTNTCVPIGSAPAPASSGASCPNNTLPGTPSDVNCPWWCNFIAFQSTSCTPCTQVCPTGMQWDTTNNVCSANPASNNCSGAGTGSPCPSYCNVPLIGGLFSACAPCAGNTSASSILAALGAVAVLYLGYKLVKK